RNASLKSVLLDIGEQTGYSFLIKEELYQRTTPISVHLKQTALFDALRACLAEQQLTFVIHDEDKTIIIKEKPANVPDVRKASAAKLVLAYAEVRGRVVDSLGQPLAGASVRVINADGQRTALQTKTNHQGEFHLQNVPEDAILQISYVGYITQEIPAEGNVDVIVLKDMPTSLDEVAI